MMTQGQNVAADLRRLIAEDRLSVDALRAVAQIESDRLAVFLADNSGDPVGLTVDTQALSPEESTRLSVLVAQLAYGFDIDDDERLRGILESLVAECGLTLQNVAHLTGVDIDDLRTAIDDPAGLSIDTKYSLALRASYLVNAANQARTR